MLAFRYGELKQAIIRRRSANRQPTISHRAIRRLRSQNAFQIGSWTLGLDSILGGTVRPCSGTHHLITATRALIVLAHWHPPTGRSPFGTFELWNCLTNLKKKLKLHEVFWNLKLLVLKIITTPPERPSSTNRLIPLARCERERLCASESRAELNSLGVLVCSAGWNETRSQAWPTIQDNSEG